MSTSKPPCYFCNVTCCHDWPRRQGPEIPVGEGMEMKALWLKRLFPRLLFKKVAAMNHP